MGLRLRWPVIDMSRKVLGISWLNGHFHAIALDGGKVSGSWLCPTRVNDDSGFRQALAEAVQQTGFAGREVRLVLDHRNLLFHVQETPPAADKLVDQVLERSIDQNHFFNEKPAWARADLPAAKGRRRFLLALIPDSIVRALVEGVAAQGLELTAVVPLAGLLEQHLRALGVPPDEMVLLVADVGGAFQLLLGKGNGTALFARTVLASASHADERAVEEISRTLHFAQQQFGTAVKQLFIFGGEAFTALKDLPFHQRLKIQHSGIPEEPLYYAHGVAALPKPFRLNLLPASPARSRRVERTAAIAMVSFLFLALTCALLVERTVRARARTTANRNRENQATEQIHVRAGELSRQAARWRAFLQVVGTTNDAPVAELFARYLSAVATDSIRLTHADVSLGPGPDGWWCRIEGVAREHPEGFVGRMQALERELNTGPFKLRITDSTYQRLLRGGLESTPLTSGSERTFFIAGTIP